MKESHVEYLSVGGGDNYIDNNDFLHKLSEIFSSNLNQEMLKVTGFLDWLKNNEELTEGGQKIISKTQNIIDLLSYNTQLVNLYLKHKSYSSYYKSIDLKYALEQGIQELQNKTIGKNYSITINDLTANYRPRIKADKNLSNLFEIIFAHNILPFNTKDNIEIDVDIDEINNYYRVQIKNRVNFFINKSEGNQTFNNLSSYKKDQTGLSLVKELMEDYGAILDFYAQCDDENSIIIITFPKR